MGYAVYEDAVARDRGVERWAGYGVPAFCDMPGCEEGIDRGLDYKCERAIEYRYIADGEEVGENDDWDDEIEDEVEGCGLFFCEQHRYDHAAHSGVEPKPDVREWINHMLTDESWAQWRAENQGRVDDLKAEVSS